MSTTVQEQHVLPEVQEFLSRGPHKAVIGGQEFASSNGATFTTRDPGSGDTLAEVYDMQPDDVERAVDAGALAFREAQWARLPINERGALLHRLADAVAKHKPIIGQIKAMDAGKIYAQAQGDVQNFVDTMRYVTDLSQHMQYRTTIAVSGHEAWTVRHPGAFASLFFPGTFPSYWSAGVSHRPWRPETRS